MTTVREEKEQDIVRYQHQVEAGVWTGESDYHKGVIERMKSELAWYNSDEIRTVWEVKGLYDLPVIFLSESDMQWAINDAELDNEIALEITEITMSGVDYGDLVFTEL
jgi:hypothetical protein